METIALWHLNKQESQLQYEKLAPIANDEILIKSLYSLVSTGTERLVAKGQVPFSLREKMQVPYMGGTFQLPIKYGYSIVGEVLSKGSLQGQLVHLLHPHQKELVVNKNAVHIIPKEVSPKRASLASNLETALTAIWDSRVTAGDKVLVVGFGMIGGLVAQLLSSFPAVEVSILEKNEYRLNIASEMGFKIYQGADENFDISFHTTSTDSGLQKSIEAVGMEGKIIELSWYGQKITQVRLGADFHYYRKQLISSQVANIPSSKKARWDYMRRKSIVFELLKDPIFDNYITNEIDFEDSPLFFQQLRANDINSEGLGWVIKYN